jgi:CubicO group peptidase (beta-lactamase class C family)
LEALDSDCLVVVRDGHIAAEWYWRETSRDTLVVARSATKSFTSALVGIAQAEGALDLDDEASDYIDEWVGTASESVTVRHLLSNDSGRRAPFRDGLTDDEALAELYPVMNTADTTAAALDLPQDHAPGEVWAYNDPAIQALDAVLQEATGQEPVAYAEERLLEPIGARQTTMRTDPAGNTRMSEELRTTCRDAARFGLLFLRQGDWDGREVLPRGWVRAATGRPSQDLFPAYGYLWWLNRRGDSPLDSQAVQLPMTHAAAFGEDRQLVAGAPDDMYWAVGAFGQIIQVDPGSRTVVVVRFGGGHPDGLSGTHFLPYTARVVTDALSDP